MVTLPQGRQTSLPYLIYFTKPESCLELSSESLTFHLDVCNQCIDQLNQLVVIVVVILCHYYSLHIFTPVTVAMTIAVAIVSDNTIIAACKFDFNFLGVPNTVYFTLGNTANTTCVNFLALVFVITNYAIVTCCCWV